MLDNFRVRLSGLAPVPVRIALAATFMVHGWEKFLGLVKEGKLPGAVGFITNPQLQQVLGWAVGLTEFVGGACILLGLLTRFWAAGQVILMSVAIFRVHLAQGFQMHGIKVGEAVRAAGYEWQLLLGCAALALFLMGPGALSLDYLLGRLFRKEDANAVIGCGMRYPARQVSPSRTAGLGEPVYSPEQQPPPPTPGTPRQG